MTDVTSADSMIRFAPIPVASGEHIGAGDHVHTVHRVEVVVTAEDGSAVVIPCSWEHGGWWIKAA
jgi:hypothetical protein